jgi:formate dehydrogenase iron-sulfur subunit
MVEAGPYMKKCDMCSERVSKGKPTACAEACPVQATIFGDRDEILHEARKRVIEDPKYVPPIYGERECGGASMLFISDVEFDKLGFVIPKDELPLPDVPKAALDEAPSGAGGRHNAGGLVLDHESSPRSAAGGSATEND